jgi:hypothetical protein
MIGLNQLTSQPAIIEYNIVDTLVYGGFLSNRK